MNLRRVWTILRKDLVDAIRDGRVLAIIVIPIALGVFYSVIYPDQEPRPKAKVVVVGSSADADRVAESLPLEVSRSLDLTVTREADERQARTTVEDDDADLAIVVPSGLLGGAKAGRAPPLRVLVGADPSPATRAVVDLLPSTVARLADTPPATTVELTTVVSTSPSVVTELGLSTFFVLASVVMVLGFIGLMATPIILAEEIEKRTIEALLLAARGSEVLTAKALVGLVYSAVATVLLVALTGVSIERPALFVFGAAGTAFSIVGFGLVFAYLFRSADKLNTWGWVMLIPVVAPAFLVGMPLGSAVETVTQVLPTGQGMRMMVDGALPSDIFGGAGVALLVFAVWGGLGLVVLSQMLQRRGS